MVYNAECKLCKAKFKANGSYNHNEILYEHLKKKHKVEYHIREYKWKLIRALENEVNYDNWFTQLD
jgi:hypothetical protein